MSEYPVQVKLSTVGGTEVKSTLENLGNVARVLQGTINDAANAGQKMSATFRQSTADGEKYSLTIRKLKNDTDSLKGSQTQVQSSSMSLSTAMGAVTAAAAMASAAVYALYNSFKSLAGPGIELNALFETSRLGIAATLLSYRDFRDAQGRVLEGDRAMTAAMAEGLEVQRLLRGAAFNTTVTLEQMLKAYQALQVGASAQKTTTAELAAFTTTLGNFATATGRSFEELSAQTSRVLQGVLTIRNPIVALLRGMGVPNETIKSWVQQGIAVEEIQKRLQHFLAIGPEINKTWAGVKSNIEDVNQQLSATMMAPFMDAAKKIGIELVQSLTDTTYEGGVAVTRIADSAVNAAKAIGEGLKGAFDVALIAVNVVMSSITGVVESNGGSWLGFFKNIGSGFVALAEFFAKGIILISEVTVHGAEVQVDLMSRLHEKFIRGAAAGWAVLAGAAGLASAALGGAGEDLWKQIDGMSKAMTAQADGLKKSREEGETTTKRLTDGYAAVEAAVLKANKAIQGIGGSGTIPAYLQPNAVKTFPEAWKNQKDPVWPPGPWAAGSVAPNQNFWEDPLLFGTKGGTTNAPKPPAPSDMTKALAAATQYKNFLERFFASIDTAGLEGLDLALAKNAKSWTENDIQITNATDKLIKQWPQYKDAINALALSLRGLNADAKELADEKSITIAAREFDAALSRIDSAVRDSALGKAADTFIQNAQKIAAAFDIAEKRIEKPKEISGMDWFDADKVEAYFQQQAAYDEKLGMLKAHRADADARNDEWLRLNKQKILAEQTGDYQKYVDALVALDVMAGRQRFAAQQDAAKKAASMLIEGADTAQKGVVAGFAAIKASITSFGQDVAALMTSVWGNLGSAFETGFYDILTGKFDDLGNVLKNLFDSILKDFSKMLAQMLLRWVMTGDAMGNGQGNGGIGGWISSLLGGGGGSNAVYTQGGTANNGSGFIGVGNPGMGQYQTAGDASWTKGGGGTNYGGYAATAAAAVGAGILTYEAFKNGFSKTSGADVSYNGTSLGQSTDFGGNAKFGDFAAAAASVVAASAMAVSAGLAASAAIVPVWGWIAAAAILIVGAIISIINGPKEGHFYVQIKEAFDKSGARTAIGGFVADVMNTTANFVGELARIAAGPGAVSKYVTAYNKAFKDALGQAAFDFHAGSGEDLNKDVTDFFNKTLPKLAMQAAFGQVGIGQPGGASVIAGMDWNTNNGTMDAAGNWIQHQLFDPKAAIPTLLSVIGFSQEKIGEIATKLSTSSDMEAFKKYLLDLVTIVAGFGDLGAQLGRTVAQWKTYFDTQGAQKGTAAEFATASETLKGQGLVLEGLTGDEQITAAKQLIQDAGTLMNQMSQALQSIFTMIDNIQKSTAATIQSYRDKLLSPSEIEAAARDRIAGDFEAITKAANPAEVQAAWQTVMKDLSTVLDAIVARINSIKALQQSYADFRTQMAKDAGPQFATDPNAWLMQNQAAIDAIDWTDPVAGAKELFTLTKERYDNEKAMLAQINSMISSITETHDTTNQNLTMQAMGHVEIDPTTGKRQWVQDTHAQGDYLKQQYDTLLAQMSTAKTPEEVQRIYNKMQGIISQLAAQPQDPSHYAESRQILIGMNDAATKAATDLLKKWGKELSTDLDTTGSKLSAGETALATALDKAEKDFEKYLGLMNDASVASTNALNLFAAQLVAAMTDLGKYMTHWSWVMSHSGDEKDPRWDYEKNQPKGGNTVVNTPTTVTSRDVWQDDPSDPTMQICVAGPSKGQKRVKPVAGGGNPGPGDQQHQTAGAPGINVSVTVNSGSPQEIADAAAAAVRSQVYTTLQQNNQNLVRVIRDNPSLIAAAY